MRSLLRRFARIFCVTILLLLFAAAVVTQFWEFALITPLALYAVNSVGIVCCFFDSRQAGWWDAGFGRLPYKWSLQNLLEPPRWSPSSGPPDMGTTLVLPWWFILVTWGLLTAVVWRFTRRRIGPGGGFPVEPAAKASPDLPVPPTPGP